MWYFPLNPSTLCFKRWSHKKTKLKNLCKLIAIPPLVFSSHALRYTHPSSGLKPLKTAQWSSHRLQILTWIILRYVVSHHNHTFTNESSILSVSITVRTCWAEVTAQDDWWGKLQWRNSLVGPHLSADRQCSGVSTWIWIVDNVKWLTVHIPKMSLNTAILKGIIHLTSTSLSKDKAFPLSHSWKCHQSLLLIDLHTCAVVFKI